MSSLPEKFKYSFTSNELKRMSSVPLSLKIKNFRNILEKEGMTQEEAKSLLIKIFLLVKHGQLEESKTEKNTINLSEFLDSKGIPFSKLNHLIEKYPVLDIPLEITIELGRTKMLINELLKLGQGSVIELAKFAGETLDVLANQKLIAKGEVVVINDKYGIRLTEIISPMERIVKLK